MIFEPHSEKQDLAIFNDKRITLCSTGIQWGKTTVGAVVIKILYHQFPGPGENFIVTAPNYKILNQATLPELKKVMKGLGEYKKGDAVFECFSGAKIFCRTSTDPDSIVGITNVRGIWGDEAGLYSYYFWVNILGRSRFKQCRIILTTSLYSYNWVCKDLIRQTERGLRDDVHVCQAESRENPSFPLDEYEKAKKTMTPARFAMMYGGRPSKMEGMVLDCFEESINVIPGMGLPNGTRVFAGIDWGFTQPFACIVVAMLPTPLPTKKFITVSEVFQTKLTDDDIINLLKPLAKVWGIERFYAGPDKPGSIKALNRAGLPCTAADNDVKAGVDLLYTLIEKAMLLFFEDSCPNLLDEIENYHWPEPKDLKPDQDDKDPNPVKQDDHAIDALRYVMMSIARKSTNKSSFKVPRLGVKPNEETIEQKLRRLKNRKNKQTEKW